MAAKWRLLILLGYVLFLLWEFFDVIVSSTAVGDLSFLIVFLLVATAPIGILCLSHWRALSLGCAAILVAGFGVWAYGANDGDPIGLLVIVFYQFCIMGIAFLAIAIGAELMGREE